VRLNPNGKVYPHIDEGEYYKVRDRYHLVLSSPGGSHMNSGGETVVFQDGELWWFDNQAVHDAFNPSPHGRIHVIFDVLPARPTADPWPVAGAQADGVGPASLLKPTRQAAISEPETTGSEGIDKPHESVPRGTLSAAVRAVLAGSMPAAGESLLPESGTGLVQVELRSAGRLVAAGWSRGSDYWDGFCQALADLRQRKGAAAANELMLSLSGPPRELTVADQAVWQHLTSNRCRGLYGYEIRSVRDPSLVAVVSPFEFIASNRSFLKTFRQTVERWGLTVEEARAGGVSLSEFETRRFRLDLGLGDSELVPLARGTRLVSLSEITRESVTALERLLSDYLVRSVQADGRMVYLYLPSRGAEDQERNNSIRQWMATRALVRIGQRRGSNDLITTIRKNIEFNLKTMYAEEDSLGLILEGPKVKLGAVALAALAIMESPFADEFVPVRDRLTATIDSLWCPDGAFHTFYRPRERDDCQNFYPGEALLFWAHRILATGDRAWLSRFQQSFTYYRSWHLENRNPAFIPWHTQAYCIVWELTRNHELADAVFAMNDWLLDVQQWESAPHPDCQGRFYDPDRPFGPPHASSTAVYLEGLADAFVLARITGERERAERYRIAILRGLRSLAQLTFKDDVDMFYIAKRSTARGGVQTSEYDNAIRVDNVQHALTAIAKILDVFSPADYAP
jgi:hypothetical protein